MVVLKKRALDRAQLLKKYWKQGSKYHLGAANFISKYENQYVVIKYGGFSLSKKKLVTSFAKNISLLNKLGVKIIIVHGGGLQIVMELKKRIARGRTNSSLFKPKTFVKNLEEIYSSLLTT